MHQSTAEFVSTVLINTWFYANNITTNKTNKSFCIDHIFHYSSQKLKRQVEDNFMSGNLFTDIHSPREIISTVCDFPYKIIEKCFQ